MPTYDYHCTVEWTGAAAGPTVDAKTFSRDGQATVPGVPPVPVSAASEFRGDGRRMNPETLFVASLATCQMLTYLYVAARQGIAVTAYADAATGVLALKDGRLRMTSVTLRPAIRLAAGTDVEQARALIEKAHQDCFIGQSITSDVVIEPQFTVE